MGSRESKKIGKLEILWAGFKEALLQSVRAWRPQPMRTELDYRNALYEYLRGVLPEDATLEREYRHLGTTCDLYLRRGSTEVFFELKRNLKQKAQLDRLVGQIERLRPRDHDIVVVLCGERDPELVGRLRDQYSGALGPKFFLSREGAMAIVEVP